MSATPYVCPQTRQLLQENPQGLLRADGCLYPWLPVDAPHRIPNFLTPQQVGSQAEQALRFYDQANSQTIYRNFLDWLFATFAEDEAAFRAALIARLQARPGDRILVTGCGLGDDLPALRVALGPAGVIHACDLAVEMVTAAARQPAADATGKLHFAVCNAQQLPYANGYFDGAFHFGGINIFDDMRAAIHEMERTVRPGGRVVFGDEGVAPWLRNTDYGKAGICNNPLWARHAPLELLPAKAMDVHLSWVLGNCFYVIDFTVSASGPVMNIDIPQNGPRGGTIRTRYYGQLEGVQPRTRDYVRAAAARSGLSVHDWLEQLIQAKRDSETTDEAPPSA